VGLLPLGILIILTIGVLIGDLTVKEWMVAIAAGALALVVVAAWT
jgi:hypothetical protein